MVPFPVRAPSFFTLYYTRAERSLFRWALDRGCRAVFGILGQKAASLPKAERGCRVGRVHFKRIELHYLKSSLATGLRNLSKTGLRPVVRRGLRLV